MPPTPPHPTPCARPQDEEAEAEAEAAPGKKGGFLSSFVRTIGVNVAGTQVRGRASAGYACHMPAASTAAGSAAPLVHWRAARPPYSGADAG